MRRPSGNDLLIATSLSGGEPLMLKKEQRSRHLYVTGSTGSGKSKFLEHLIRQDIKNWRKGGECGLLLLRVALKKREKETVEGSGWAELGEVATRLSFGEKSK